MLRLLNSVHMLDKDIIEVLLMNGFLSTPAAVELRESLDRRLRVVWSWFQ